MFLTLKKKSCGVLIDLIWIGSHSEKVYDSILSQVNDESEDTVILTFQISSAL